MRQSRQYVSPHGKIAIPLIILAALCFLDQFFNAVDYVRPSGMMCMELSFPLGWLAQAVAGSLASALAPRHETAMVFIASAMGCALNIYLLAFGISFLLRLVRKKQPDA